MSAELKSIFGSLPHVERTTPVHLGGDPKGKNFLYCNGTAVYMRDIANPEVCEIYNQHSFNTTVARYSPSGYYIASADVSGTIRVWDTVNKEHILKSELRPFGGAIKDLCWGPESKRIMACGQGNEKFAHVMMWDTGSSLGQIDGHTKSVNSCALRQSRPYRAVTGGEDFKSNFYQGPPFKFNKMNEDHGRYINCVRFNPSGERYITCGSDFKMVMYDGKTGDKIGLLGGDKAHDGAILSCSFVDEHQLLSCSTDKTVKLWDIERNTAVSTFTFGKEVEYQQLGVLAQGEHWISVGLNGQISYLDKNQPTTPLRTLSGHTVTITDLAVEDEDTLYSASYDGRICCWHKGQATRFEGQGGHTNEVVALGLDGGRLVTVGKDDTVKTTPTATRDYAGTTSGALESVPKGLGIGKGGLAVVAGLNEVSLIRDGKVVVRVPTDHENLCAAVSPDGQSCAVGAKDHVLRVYAIVGETLNLNHSISTHAGEVSTVAYSPDGKYLASGDSDRKILVHDPASGKKEISGWCYHTSRVCTMDWSPDSTHLVSGGLDGGVIVWSTLSIRQRVHIKHAHKGGVSAVRFVDDHTVVAAGVDSSITTWAITRHA